MRASHGTMRAEDEDDEVETNREGGMRAAAGAPGGGGKVQETQARGDAVGASTSLRAWVGAGRLRTGSSLPDALPTHALAAPAATDESLPAVSSHR